MVKLVDLPNRSNLHAEASQWLAALDRGLSEQERESLGDWLAQTPVHRDVLFKMAALWDDMAMLRELSTLFPLQSDTQMVHDTGKPARLGRYGAIAAVLLVTCSLAWFAIEDRAGSIPGPVAGQTIEQYQTEIGEQRVQSLPDGSSIQLNTRSRASLVYSAAQRVIVLEYGEVHFEVAHDPRRPFVVKAGGRYFKALGTAFNLCLGADDALELLVTEGKVMVSDASALITDVGSQHDSLPDDFYAVTAVTDDSLSTARPLTVLAGEKLSITPAALGVVEKLDLPQQQARLAWQQGMLVFQGEPLHQVLSEVARYTSTSFEIAEQSIADVRVAGFFKAGDIDGLLVSLRDNFHISYQRTDHHIVLTSAQAR